MGNPQVSTEDVKEVQRVLEALANGEFVHLKDFGNGVDERRHDAVAMLLRELAVGGLRAIVPCEMDEIDLDNERASQEPKTPV